MKIKVVFSLLFIGIFNISLGQSADTLATTAAADSSFLGKYNFSHILNFTAGGKDIFKGDSFTALSLSYGLHMQTEKLPRLTMGAGIRANLIYGSYIDGFYPSPFQDRTANKELMVYNINLYGINALVNANYKIIKGLCVGVNTDLSGFSFGKPRTLRDKYLTTYESAASPVVFNALTSFKGTRGLIKNEVYAIYYLKPAGALGLKISYSRTTAEYTLDEAFYFDENKRYKNTKTFFNIGISFKLNRRASAAPAEKQ